MEDVEVCLDEDADLFLFYEKIDGQRLYATMKLKEIV